MDACDAMIQKSSPDNGDEILEEYDFSEGVRGKHHGAYKEGTNVAFLELDIAQDVGEESPASDPPT